MFLNLLFLSLLSPDSAFLHSFQLSPHQFNSPQNNLLPQPFVTGRPGSTSKKAGINRTSLTSTEAGSPTAGPTSKKAGAAGVDLVSGRAGTP